MRDILRAIYFWSAVYLALVLLAVMLMSLLACTIYDVVSIRSMM